MLCQYEPPQQGGDHSGFRGQEQQKDMDHGHAPENCDGALVARFVVKGGLKLRNNRPTPAIAVPSQFD
jgi:hypothetical protein